MTKWGTKLLLSLAISLATIGAGLALTDAPPAFAASIVTKMATPTFKDGQNEFLIRLAAAVNKDSGGRIEASVFPAGQLGPVPQEIEETQLGAIQVFVSPAEYLEDADPKFQVLAAPGLFKNVANLQRTLLNPAFRKAYYAVGQHHGLIVLSAFMSGPTVIDLRKPVNSINQLRGLKIRVMASPMQMQPLNELGATPEPISLGQVLPALQQGTIDGVLSVFSVLSAFHYYSTAPYILQTDYSFAVSTAVMSKTWFDKLPPDLQKVIIRDGRQIGDHMLPWVQAFYQKQKAIWLKAGGKIETLSPAEREMVMAQMTKVSTKVVADNPAIRPLYDQVADIAKSAH